MAESMAIAPKTSVKWHKNGISLTASTLTQDVRLGSSCKWLLLRQVQTDNLSRRWCTVQTTRMSGLHKTCSVSEGDSPFQERYSIGPFAYGHCR